MAELVHPVPIEEVPGWARTMAANFLSDPHHPETTRRVDMLLRNWEAQRAWGVRDHGRWVATLRTEARTMTVPGLTYTREVTVDAVTNVTVAATHRRRGLMRAMLEQSLDAARERGDAMSILIAAEWPIYGRFGYAPATLSADYVLRQSRPGSTLCGDLSWVRQVERDEFGDVAAAVFKEARRDRHGQLDRDQGWWDRVLGRDGYQPSESLPHHYLVHESRVDPVTGVRIPDGLLAWKAAGDGGLVPPLGRVEVWNLTAASDVAYRNLWSYLAGIDGSDEVVVHNRPVDEPVRWMLHDARTLVMTEQVDFTWLRLLDVPAALSARRYPVDGELVLAVTDQDTGGYAAGRYRLSVDGEDVSCERTDARADLELSQRALASIYLGGFRLGPLAYAGAVHPKTTGALQRADAMFATHRAPWNATWF